MTKVLFCLAAGLGVSLGATLTHNYEFNGDFQDGQGGPSITSLGGSVGATSYDFSTNQGLALSGALNATNYSIVMRYINTSAGLISKIVDYDGEDTSGHGGVYLWSGLYPIFTDQGHNGIAMPSNTPHVMVITRDGNDNSLVGTFDGQEAFAFTDTAGKGVFNLPGNLARFFYSSTGNTMPGSIDYIRIYEGALSSGEIAGLTDAPPPSPTPEPGTLALLACGAAVVWRKYRNAAAHDHPVS